VCPDCAGRGCAACVSTGYRGRVPAVEWLRVDAEARRQLRAGELDSLRTPHTLAESARELLAAGLSDLREYERVFGQPPE
jgi:type II secretory ATPase GspE/PulE/Tfp pilus assembly ATPase PilB-like protein